MTVYLDKNENAFDIPENVKYEFMEYIKKTNLNRYPEKGLPSLLEKIGDFSGFNDENIIVGNGSDELLNILINQAKGDILINTPTFEMYNFYANNYGYNTVNVPLKSDFSLDTENIINKNNIKLIIICSPNNPTGNLIDMEQVEQILELGIPTILDNAYYEFSGEDYTDLLNKHDNLIILRTFSKAFSMAGLRIGYGIANKNVISNIKKLQAPFYMNVLSAKLAEIMIDNYSTVREHVKYIINERERFYNAVKEIAYDSKANFLFLKKDLYSYMEKHDIIIRKLPLLKDRSRITVGKKEENDIAIDAIKEYISKNL